MLDTSALVVHRRRGESEPAALTPLQKRARAKYLSRAIAGRLAMLDSPLQRSYRNTLYCADVLGQRDGTLTTKYCGNRWCLVCNRIRTARAMDRYIGPMLMWDDRWFVTLTWRNCTGPALAGELRALIDSARKLCRAMKRTDGFKVCALRKVECTYNPLARGPARYHPHLHFIINGEPQARTLVRRWLQSHPDSTDARAQDARRCESEGALRELFKYFTKLFVKPSEGASMQLIAAPALDLIFRAMKGLRVYQPVGFRVDLGADENADELADLSGTRATSRVGESIEWTWVSELADWCDDETGELLTSYEPSARVRGIVAAIALSSLRERRTVA